MQQARIRAIVVNARRYIFAGILVLIPLWVTWLVFEFLFGLLSDLGRPWVAAFFAVLQRTLPEFAEWISTPLVESAIAIVTMLAALYLLGWSTTNVLGKRILAYFEALLARIPLVQAIYGSTKKLLAALQTKPQGVQRVVLIDFPSPEMKAVGLVTSTLVDKNTGRELAVVYVPTAPNPTSGYVEIVPVDMVISTDWTLDEAMRFVITGGTSAPGAVDYGAAATRTQTSESR